MNILVIFTGGTIASSENDGYLAPNEATQSKLISLYEKKHPDRMSQKSVSFKTVTPFRILSENLEANYVNQLVACVKENLNASYDGIIVTHGTDTLQYTAAALGICFRNTKIPVILVSSNYILDDLRANGLTNFEAAVDYICDKCNAGVFVSYANEKSPAAIYPATKLFAHLPYDDALHTADKLVDVNLFSDKESSIDFASTSLCTQAPVMYLRAMPGLIYPALTDSIKVVLLESYHSGTLCTAGNPLKTFCEAAYARHIPVYLVGVEDRTAYESTKAYEQLHIKVLPKASPITAYMLAWYLTSEGTL